MSRAGHRARSRGPSCHASTARVAWASHSWAPFSESSSLSSARARLARAAGESITNLGPAPTRAELHARHTADGDSRRDDRGAFVAPAAMHAAEIHVP